METLATIIRLIRPIMCIVKLDLKEAYYSSKTHGTKYVHG